MFSAGTVLRDPAIAVAGMLAHVDQDEVDSAVVAEATGIDPGLAVVLTADALTCELPDAAGEWAGPRALGVSVWDANRVPGTPHYALNDTCGFVRKGFIWVLTETSATAGAVPFVRHTVNGGTVLGAFRHDADTANAEQHNGLVWRSTRATPGLALVEVNLPGLAA